MRQAIALLRDPAVFSAGDGLALGDFYRLRVPGYNIHVVTDPAAIEQDPGHRRLQLREEPHLFGGSSVASSATKWARSMDWDHAGAFDPDRFRADRAAAMGKYQYLPFGAGRHVCIGQHLALPCLVLTTAQFAQQFAWSFDDPNVQPVGLSTLSRPESSPPGLRT